jgi:hypothetical protein
MVLNWAKVGRPSGKAGVWRLELMSACVYAINEDPSISKNKEIVTPKNTSDVLAFYRIRKLA